MSPTSCSSVRVLVIGAGSRGRAYAEAISTHGFGIVAAVAEPDTFKRSQFAKDFIKTGSDPETSQFPSWHDFIQYERTRRTRRDADLGVDAVFVCVLDEQHKDVVLALAELGGLHVMCEKPLATTLSDCVSMYRALMGQDTILAIGHVLRYSPHNILLRKLLLEDRIIGDVLSVEHTEPVGWWHFTHSYVRGNWRRESTTAPSLLTKSCHDIDVLLWLLCSPPSYTDPAARPHLPSSVTSTGSLQFFRRTRKPVAAGKATNCLSCPAEPQCKYSAKRIYVGSQLNGLASGNTQWPVSIVLPEIEDISGQDMNVASEKLLERLSDDYDDNTPPSDIAGRNWFGRCVFESDNDVCDDQTVIMTWEDDPLPASNPGERAAKTATLHMVAHSKKICQRYSHIYGSDGEVYADSSTITVEDFRTGETTVHKPPVESFGHGGGDVGLARQFMLAVDRVKNDGYQVDRAQREILGCTLEEILRSHAMVFCAEEARKGKRVIGWPDWWAQEVESKLA